MRSTLIEIFQSRRWEQFIVAVIIVNAVTLGLETSGAVMAAIGPQLLLLDKAILAIFVVEIALRLTAWGPRFFREPWNVFDFTVVAIALVPATGPLQVLRSLRILRVLRLVSIVPSLRRVIGGLVAALPGMSSIIVLLALMFYVSAVMATKLFGASFPDWFGSLGASAYTLFQVMTLESWSMGIVRPVMEVHPYAWAFFVPFILMHTYAVLNLFIGVVVSAMQEEAQTVAHDEREALHGDNAALLTEMRLLRQEIAEMKAARAGAGL